MSSSDPQAYHRSQGRSKKRRSRSKRSRKKHESYTRSSSSSSRGDHRTKYYHNSGQTGSNKNSPNGRISLNTYKANLPPLSPEDAKMNLLCRQLGLKGGEYRDGYYVRYVEVPGEKPQTIHEDRVVYVDVPEIEYITREIEDRRVEEVIKKVPRKVEVPREVVKHVPKVKKVKRTLEVPVPGDIVDRPIPYEVPRYHQKPTYHDTEQEVVVSQVVKPKLNVNKGKSLAIDAYTIDPVLYPVDVFVPFPVQSTLKATKVGTPEHRHVEIPSAHYNSLVNKMNDTVPDDFREALFKTKKGRHGKQYVPLLPPSEAVHVTTPQIFHDDLRW